MEATDGFGVTAQTQKSGASTFASKRRRGGGGGEIWERRRVISAEFGRSLLESFFPLFKPLYERVTYDTVSLNGRHAHIPTPLNSGKEEEEEEGEERGRRPRFSFVTKTPNNGRRRFFSLICKKRELYTAILGQKKRRRRDNGRRLGRNNFCCLSFASGGSGFSGGIFVPKSG